MGELMRLIKRGPNIETKIKKMMKCIRQKIILHWHQYWKRVSES